MTAVPRASIEPGRAETLVERFRDQPVLVVGDLMLDRFIVGRVTRISPEAPVPVVQFQSEHARLGGAANVANNIGALGGRARIVGVAGADAPGQRLTDLLAAAHITSDVVRDPSRPTTEKVRVVTERNQQVARIDYERETDVNAEIEKALVARIAKLAAGSQTLLVSDYLKGAVTRRVVEALLDGRGMQTITGERVPVLVDPKIPHLTCYAGATLVTPNQHEAESATHMRIRNDAEACAAAREFRYRAKCEAALVTRGEHGMWLSSEATDLSIAAHARSVADVTGAGDTVVATLALALAAGATLIEAAVLANHAAGVVVGKFGPATVTPDELLASLRDSV